MLDQKLDEAVEVNLTKMKTNRKSLVLGFGSSEVVYSVGCVVVVNGVVRGVVIIGDVLVTRLWSG